MRQAQAMTVMMSGSSVFLTGAPGSGKSFVLAKFVRNAQKKGRKVAVTASTGVAATQIGGTTIHSWSGIGIRDKLDAKDLAVLSKRKQLVLRFQTTDVLVIDEISMLSGRFLDMVDSLAKALRGDPQPFGGLQIILVGDMFQLPPVNRGSTKQDFAHNSTSWKELSPLVCYLSEQHRQSNDGLLEVLKAMRNGELNEDHVSLLRTRLNLKPHQDVKVTRLYSHNVDVDSINQKQLVALEGKVQQYEMTTTGTAHIVEQLAKGVLAPRLLELKIGAEVMFVANDPSRAFVNGTRGRVIRFEEGRPVVALTNGRTILVVPHTWQSIEDDRVRAEVVQLPLRLAWAITIHKSQGMSIDAAEVDLSRSFTPGMGYVALSRLRSLDGLYISGINTMALRLHPAIFELDEALSHSSNILAKETIDYVDKKVSSVSKTVETVSKKYHNQDDLLDALKAWRRARAQEEGVPLYMIAHNSQLEEISEVVPLDENELLTIKGIGIAKLESFGDDILSLTRAYDLSEKA